jgi:hypothetical protein
MMPIDRDRARERVRVHMRARISESYARLAGLVVAAALCATCGQPVQSGGVNVASGAGDRFGILCRFKRGGEESDAALCDPGDKKVAPARARRIERGSKRLGGPLAIGGDGDYAIENDEVVFVVNQLGRGVGFAEGGGNVVDAADARVRRDELGQLFTYFGVFPRQAVYTSLKHGTGSDGTAWIEVSGRELYAEELKVTTRYSLGPLDRALVIATTLENTSDKSLGMIELGDAVQWGSAEKIAPGKAPGFRGDYAGMYVGGVGKHVAYLLAPVKDAEVVAKNGTAWSNVSFERDVVMSPKAKVTYERVFAVAPRGDPVAVATEFFYMQGGSPGGLAVKLVDARGKAVAPPEGGRVLLERARAEGEPPSWADTWWMGASAEAEQADVIGGEVPPGRYTVRFEGGGRKSEGKAATVEVKPGVVAQASLAVTDAGKLRVSAREALPGAGASGRPAPVKITLLDAATGKPVIEPRFAKGGDLEISVAPGRYRLIASRGPEYSLGEASVDVRAGEITAEQLSITRVVDTRGYIGCDLHQHTAHSDDSGVSMAERVLSNVVEGVECAVASEHNMVVDPAPIVRELGLQRELAMIAGNEITSDASRVPFGHLNVFPLPVDPSDARGGSTPVRDRTAKQVMDDVLAIPGERVIQVNHPRSGLNGYFDQLKFDPATGVGSAPGYDARFDAIEVWSGRYIASRSRVLDDLWALLRASRPVTPTGNTDTHGITGYEAGYPRTYVRVPSDDPGVLDAGALIDGIKKRREVVITNGPFVTVSAAGVVQGGILSAKDGGKARTKVDLVIRIERAKWVDASELVLWVGGAPGQAIPLTGEKTTDRGALVDEITIPIHFGKAAGAAPKGKGLPLVRIAEDSFLVAVVRGVRPLEPVLFGDPAEIAPFAMTSPLWIDADGDGRALGR